HARPPVLRADRLGSRRWTPADRLRRGPCRRDSLPHRLTSASPAPDRARSRTIGCVANSSTAEPASFIAIPDDIRAFIDDIRFATISTINPDGSPWQAVVWYTVDDDEIVLNSKVGRRWPNNLLRDQRIAFSVIDDADGDRWIGLN